MSGLRRGVVVSSLVLVIGGCGRRLDVPAPGSNFKWTGPKAGMVKVTVFEDCTVSPDPAVIEYRRFSVPWSTVPQAVAWVYGEPKTGEQVVIRAKPAADQDEDAEQGSRIRELLHSAYTISNPAVADAVSSGRVRRKPDFQAGKDVIWRYEVEITGGNIDPCKNDPGVCIKGTSGCGAFDE